MISSRRVLPLANVRREAASTSSWASSRPIFSSAMVVTFSARSKPPVVSRFSRILPDRTSRPSITSRIAAAAPPVRASTSLRVSHSACQAPTACSCSWAIAACNVLASGATRWAQAPARTEPTGLRLCGRVEEPPRPPSEDSATSPTSVWANRTTSRASFALRPRPAREHCPTRRSEAERCARVLLAP